MTAPAGRHTVTSDRFDAVLFDLDGVITKTASLHLVAWKDLFDEYLKQVAKRKNETFRPFAEDDYRRYVDGKLRYDGVSSFLESRDIHLPWGDPADDEGMETVCGLGNRKNRRFRKRLKKDGAEVFPSTVSWIRELTEQGVRIGVVSSSKNCAAILEAAGIADLFDLRFDGKDAARHDIAGKPSPDTYLEAARRMGVEPGRTVVVEDAISGVQAGRAGGFGLVIGVDRTGDAQALGDNGADLVVGDLEEMRTRGRRS